ncbi:hypothetical protein LP419_12055 [Massilia sp. H-1]|nr:hypothetical protein LP419_12055 [Massilia sp. H-1]
MQTAVRPPARSRFGVAWRSKTGRHAAQARGDRRRQRYADRGHPAKNGRRQDQREKDGGRTTEVKVRTGKSAYTMKGAHPSAVNERGNATGSTLGTPQWQVLEFDLARKKKTDKEAVLRPRTFRRRHRRPS